MRSYASTRIFQGLIALNWAKKVMLLKPNYQHQHTVAFIYYQLGKCKTAKKEAEKAIRMKLLLNQYDYDGSQNLIDAIDNGKCPSY